MHFETEKDCDGDGEATGHLGPFTFWVDYTDMRTPDDRAVYRWKIKRGDSSWEGEDLNGPACGTDPTPLRMLGTLLVFVSAALEAKDYKERHGSSSGNEDLFPASLLDALRDGGMSSDDCSLLAAMIEETL